MDERVWKIAWNDAMSVGIPEIDEDEKRFISLVDDFNRSIVDRMEITEVRNRLEAILNDTQRHFSEEERLLRGRRYPDVGEHAIAHTQLRDLIRHFSEASIYYRFDREWIEAGLNIKEALLNHILIEDKKYADYYRASRGIGGT